MNGRCPLGTCERCNALYRAEQEARCPNRPQSKPQTRMGRAERGGWHAAIILGIGSTLLNAAAAWSMPPAALAFGVLATLAALVTAWTIWQLRRRS